MRTGFATSPAFLATDRVGTDTGGIVQLTRRECAFVLHRNSSSGIKRVWKNAPKALGRDLSTYV